jgi:putative transposase
MKRARFAETQIVAILKETDSGISVKEVCRKHEMSYVTYYNWKSKYGGMEASDLKRMKEPDVIKQLEKREAVLK